jgi:hypothetical protein
MKTKKIGLKSIVFLITLFLLKSIQSQINLNDGLIAHLPLDENGTDISGNNNDATVELPYVFRGIDRFENFPGSMRFAGEASTAKMSFNQPLLNNLNEYTVSFWFWLHSQNGNGMNIFGQDNILEVGHFVSPNRLVFYHPTSGAINYELSSPFYNNWRHIIIVGNSSELKIYVNGQLVITRNGNFSTGSSSFNTNIGGHVLNQTTTNWLRGGFDDLRIYNRVINKDEIDALYAANTPEINITSLNNTTFCAGDNISVSFTASGEISTNNIYRLQMSDANGNFSTPLVIETIASNNLSGTFNTTIPNGTPSGTNYRFRVTSSLMSAVSDTTSTCTINGVLGNIPSSTYQFVGEINEKIYYKSSGTSGWLTSQNTSVSNGGHLATIPSQEANNLLFNNARLDRPHIGFRNSGNGFEWVNGDEVVFVNGASTSTTNNFAEMRGYDGIWIAVPNTSTQKHYLELNPQGLNTTFCTTDDIELQAFELPGATYQWTGPNGFSSSDAHTIISSATSLNQGTYQLTYTLNGCVSPILKKQITMNALPGNTSVSALNSSICPGQGTQIIIENSLENHTYQLYNFTEGTTIGTPQSGNGNTLIFNTGNLNSNTEFNIIVDNINTGCNSVTPNLEIMMLPAPNAPTTLGDEVCNKGAMTLIASGASEGEFYNWYKDNLRVNQITGLTLNTLNIDTNVTAIYYVSITGNNGCESTLTQVQGTVINPLNPPVDLISGLILHYKFDGNLADSSGFGYNATVSGSNSYVMDRHGNPESAIRSTSNSPDGGNNWINAGNPAEVRKITNQISVSFWIKQNQTYFGSNGDNGYMPLINKYNGTNGLYIGLNMYTTSTTWQNRVRFTFNGTTVLASNTNVPVGQWHHIVCTYNGSQLRIYQNGELTGTLNQTGNIPNTAVNLFLGRWAHGTPPGGITYRGEWDEVKIYNRALNLSEIQTLYNNESVAFATSPFCDGEGDLALTTFDFPGATYSWSGPNGFTSNQQNPTVILNADSLTYAGSYSLQVTAQGCTSPPQTVEAVIYQIPTAPFTINDTICGSGNGILTAQGAPSGASYRWYTVPTGGTPLTGQTSATLTVNNVSSTTSRYVSIVRNGCEGPRSEANAIYINAINRNLNVNGSTACKGENTEISIFQTESDVKYQAMYNGNPISEIVEGGGDIQIIINTTEMNIGNNSITITAMKQGCGATNLNNQALINVLPIPNLHIISDGSLEFCFGNEVLLSSSEEGNYLWSNGATSKSITVSTSQEISLTVTDNNGCVNTASVSTTVHPNPTVNAGTYSLICSGEGVTLVANGTPSGLSFSWNNGGSQNGTVFPLSTATYTVTATDGNGCTAQDQVTIQVNEVPQTPTIISNGATTFCEGESVILTSSSASNNLWSNGATSQSITVSDAGAYSVTVTENGCSSTSTSTNVSVNSFPATPTINVSSATSICEGESVILTSSSASNNLWSNGATSQSITVSDAGAYSVTVTENGCSSTSTSTNVSVNSFPATPTINVSSATSICEGESVILTSSSASNNLWSNGATSQSITVSDAGAYSVTVTENGCSSTSTSTNVSVNSFPATPIISASGATTFCEGESVILTSSSASNNLWSNGATSQSITVSDAGAYSVTVTENGCSSTSTSTNVSVNSFPATPIISASGATTFCEGESVILTSSSASNNLWSNGATSQSITVSDAGAYSVTVTENGCSSTSTSTNVSVNSFPATPIISASGATTFCEGESVILTSSSAPNNLWSNGATSQSITVSDAGAYSVTVTENGCSSTSTSTNVSVNSFPATPIISASGATTFCEGESVILTSSSASNNLWSNGATSQSITVSDAGAYSVTVTENGCSSTSTSTNVSVNSFPATPIISASGATTFCEGESVILTSSSASNNTWSTGETTQSITVNNSGSYSVTVGDAACSSTTTSTTVTVIPIPNVYLADFETVCLSATAFELTQGSPSEGEYSGVGVTGNMFNPSVAGVGSTEISYTVTENGCSNAVIGEIEVEECLSVDKISMLNLKVYPNPTKGIVTIEGDIKNYTTIELVDAVGRIIKFWNVNSIIETINVSEFAVGNYNLMFRGNQSSDVKKIQIMK